LPGSVQAVVPLTVAGGWVMVDVLLVQPGWPLVQPPPEEPSREMLQARPAPQFPGQEEPQAVAAELKNPPTLPVDGHEPGG
jgi:hypothetical protein